MLTRRSMPMPQVKPHGIPLGGGLDVMSSPLAIKPGRARASMNYEVAFGGGWERVRGFERYDGRAAPSDAMYATLVPATVFGALAAGDTVVGATSGATGVVIYVEAAYVAITKVTGTFGTAEQILKSGVPMGLTSAATPAITSQQDNVLFGLAADSYRPHITAVPGSGPVRGIAALGSTLYAWRDNAGGTAMEIYRATAAGWVAVNRYYEFSFTSGTSAYADGGTLTQGGVSATIKRVVLESGSWGSTAAGRLIVTLPTGGNFANGAAVGTGACTLASVPANSALAQISFLPGGRVETDAHNFYGSQDTRRLYGCDGINREFEFDGDVWVPLKTGMTVRASFVRAHLNYLWFAFHGSLQKSAPGNPYVYNAIIGAAELGVGDAITGLATIPGDQSTSSLVVTCKESAHVLYGLTTDTFRLIQLSRSAGANAYSLQSLTIPCGHDQQGFRLFKPTQAFGNFEWDIASKSIDSLARNRTPTCSVFSFDFTHYRCFFADGSAISGTPRGRDVMEWSQLNYGIAFCVAHSGKLGGRMRTFYGDASGFVYEADVGRSFDGQPIQAVLRLASINLGSSMVEKRFYDIDVEVTSESAFTLLASAEFDDGNPNIELVTQQSLSMVGQGGLWDISLWNQARWDSAAEQRKGIEVPGIGYAIAPIFYCISSIELSHTIKSVAVTSAPLKLRKPS